MARSARHPLGYGVREREKADPRNSASASALKFKNRISTKGHSTLGYFALRSAIADARHILNQNLLLLHKTGRVLSISTKRLRKMCFPIIRSSLQHRITYEVGVCEHNINKAWGSSKELKTPLPQVK
jgi:hypothetical protein